MFETQYTELALAVDLIAGAYSLIGAVFELQTIFGLEQY